MAEANFDESGLYPWDITWKEQKASYTIQAVFDDMDKGSKEGFGNRKLAAFVKNNSGNVAAMTREALLFLGKRKWSPNEKFDRFPDALGWHVAAYLESSPIPEEDNSTLVRLSSEFALRNSHALSKGRLDTPEKLKAAFDQVDQASARMLPDQKGDALARLILGLAKMVPFALADLDDSQRNGEYWDLCKKLAASSSGMSDSTKSKIKNMLRDACEGMEQHDAYLGRLQDVLDLVGESKWTIPSYAMELVSAKEQEEKKLREEGERLGLLPEENIVVTQAPDGFSKDKFLNVTFPSLASLLRAVHQEQFEERMRGHITTGFVIDAQVAALDRERDLRSMKEWPALGCYKYLREIGEWKAIPANKDVKKESPDD